MLALNEQNSTENAVEGKEKTLEEEIENFPSYRRYMYELCDMGYWADFYRMFGFKEEGIDYEAETDPVVEIPSIKE